MNLEGGTIEIHAERRSKTHALELEAAIFPGLFKAGLFELRMKISIFRAFIKVHRGVYEIANTLLTGRKNAEAV